MVYVHWRLSRETFLIEEDFDKPQWHKRFVFGIKPSFIHIWKFDVSLQIFQKTLDTQSSFHKKYIISTIQQKE
jgi:hypothetical protein